MPFWMLAVVMLIVLAGVAVTPSYDKHDAGMAALRAGEHEQAVGLFSAALTDRSVPSRSRAIILNNRAVASFHLSRFDAMRRDLAEAHGLLSTHTVLRRNYAEAFAATAAAPGWETRDLQLGASGYRPEPIPLAPWWRFWRKGAL